MKKHEVVTENPRNQEDDWCLPIELTLEIFIRLPPKTLGKLQLVSSKWYFLISGTKFAKVFSVSNFAKPQTLIFETRSCISSFKFDVAAATNNLALSLKATRLEHPLPESRRGIHYYCAGSYNGVVCVQITDPDARERVFVWNPITREVKSIALPHRSGVVDKFTSFFKKRYWFGYVDALDDVVIFCLLQKQSYVYSMKRNEWRESRNSGRFHIGFERKVSCRYLGSRFVHIDGVLYCAFGVDHVLEFDLVRETFRRMNFTNEAHQHRHVLHKNDTYDVVDASLGVTQERKLCSCRVFRCTKMDDEEEEQLELWMLEVWMLDCLEEPGSWNRLYRIELGLHAFGQFSYPWHIGFTHDEKVFVGGSKLLVVDRNKAAALQVQEVETEHAPIYTVSYLETLLSPFSLEAKNICEGETNNE